MIKIKKNSNITFTKAIIFKKIIENSPKGYLIYILFSLGTITLQTGLIFYDEVSIAYEAQGGSYGKSKSIMSRDGVFNRMTSYLDPITLLKTFSSTFFMILIFVLTVYFLALALSIHKCESFIQLSSLKVMKRSNKFVEFFLKTQSVLIMNYDLIFYIINSLAFTYPLCRKTPVSAFQSIDTGAEFFHGAKNYSTTHVNEIFSGTKRYVTVTSVSVINDEMVCGSSNYFLVLGCVGLLLISNFYLKYVSVKLMKFTPSVKIFGCKYGNTDMVLEGTILFIQVAKSAIMWRLKENYLIVRILFFVFLALLVVSFVLILESRPFYNHYKQKIKSFQAFYLIFLTSFSILVRETKIQKLNTELSTLITMMLCFSIFVKINMNLSTYSPQALCSNIEDIKNIDPGTLLRLYYVTCMYIDESLKNQFSGNNISKEIREIEFSLGYLVQDHKKNCTKPRCYCKDVNYVNDLLHTMPISEKIRSYLRILDVIFKENLLKYGKQDIYVFYAYLDLLINYIGRPSFANVLLQKKIYELSLAARNRGDVPEEMKMLLLSMKTLGQKNLFDGKLMLNKYDLNESHEIEIRNRKKERINVLTHILFLDGIESMKRKMRSCIKLKDKFLKMLNEKTVLDHIYKITFEFYHLKCQIQEKFKEMEIECGRKYGPLYLVYGNFVFHICQNKRAGIELLREYAKKKKMKINLNNLFTSNRKMHSLEFCVVSISAEKENFHRIIYSSSNVSKWLGWRVNEFIGKDLSIILPPLVSDVHVERLNPKRINGTLFFRKHLTPQLCLHRKGHLLFTKLGVRLGSSIEKGLTYLGILNFDLNESTKMIITVDDTSMITGMTKSARRYFKKGDYLADYQVKMEKIFDDMNRISQERIKSDFETNEEFYKRVLKKESTLNSWITYMKWSKRSNFRLMLPRNKEIIKTMGRFEEYYIDCLQVYARYLIIEKVNRSIYDNVTMSIDESLKEKKKILQPIVATLERVKKKKVAIKDQEYYDDFEEDQTDSSVIDNILVDNKEEFEDFMASDTRMIMSGRSLMKPSFHMANSQLLSRKDTSIMSNNQKDNNFSRMNSIHQQRPKITPSMIGRSFNALLMSEQLQIQEQTNKFKNSLLETEMKNTALLPSVNSNWAKMMTIFKSTLSNQKSVVSNKSIEPEQANFKQRRLDRKKSSLALEIPGQKKSKSPEKNNRKKREKKAKKILSEENPFVRLKDTLNLIRKAQLNDSASVGSINSSNHLKFSHVESLAEREVDPKKYHKNELLGACLFCIIIVLNSSALKVNSPFLHYSQSDIAEVAVIADYFSQEIYTQTYSIFHLDILRMLAQGWISDDYGSYFHVDSMANKSIKGLKTSSISLEKATENIDYRMKNLSFPYLFDFETWVRKDSRLPLLEQNYETGEVEWVHAQFTHTACAKLIQGWVMRYISGRDYRDNSSIVKIAGNQERNSDIGEEYYRRVALSEFNRDYIAMSHDFYEYLKAVLAQLYHVTYWSSHGAIYFTLFAFVVYMIYQYLQLRRMRHFYKTLLEIKVKDLNEAKDAFESKKEMVLEILKEEKIQERNNTQVYKIMTSKLNTDQRFEIESSSLKNDGNDEDDEDKSKLDLSSSTAQIDSAHNKLKRRNEILRGERNRTNLQRKMTLYSKGINFGISSLTMKLTLLLLIVIVVQYGNFLMWNPTLQRMKNYNKVYVLGVDTWTSYFTLHQAFFSAILWNNTLPYWGITSLQVYDEMREYIEEKIVKNYTQALEYDLGSYTEKFREAYSRGNSCRTVLSIDKDKHLHCQSYYDGLFNSNLISAMKGMLVVLDNILEKWKQNRHDFDKVLKLFQEKKFVSILAKFDEILETLYTWNAAESSRLLLEEMQASVALIEIVDHFNLPVMLLLTGAFYFSFVREIKNVMVNFYSILLIIPFSLIESNNIMVYKLSKIRRGSNNFY